MVHGRTWCTPDVRSREPPSFLTVSAVEGGSVGRTFTHLLFASVRVIRRSQIWANLATLPYRALDSRKTARDLLSKVIYDERVKVFSAP